MTMHCCRLPGEMHLLDDFMVSLAPQLSVLMDNYKGMRACVCVLRVQCYTRRRTPTHARRAGYSHVVLRAVRYHRGMAPHRWHVIGTSMIAMALWPCLARLDVDALLLLCVCVCVAGCWGVGAVCVVVNPGVRVDRGTGLQVGSTCSVAGGTHRQGRGWIRTPGRQFHASYRARRRAHRTTARVCVVGCVALTPSPYPLPRCLPISRLLRWT